MDLERCAAVLRPRRPWEAVDLGFALTRHLWRPVFGALWKYSWPWYALGLAIAWKAPFLGFLLSWWLRPFFDRMPLFVLSRSFFGAPPTADELRENWGAWWRNGFFSDLTWRRFDPQRSFLAPIDQLEGAAGRARERREVFKQRADVASGLTSICLVAEVTLFLAIVALLELLIPGGIFADPTGEETLLHPFAGVVLVVVAWGAFLLIEPFYVGAGFALYLQRRVEVEGWDIELAFRRLRKRLEGGHSPSMGPRGSHPRDPRRGARAALLALALAAAWLVPPAGEKGVWADEPAEFPEVRRHLDEIYAAEDFGGKHQEKQWRFRDLGLEVPEGDLPSAGLSWTFGLVGAILRLLVVLGLIGAIVYFLVRFLRSRGPSETAPPEIQSGKVQPWSPEALRAGLPADVVGTALEWAREGRLEDAVGLLYRGAVAALVARGLLPERDDYTEGEFVDHLRRTKQGTLAQALQAVVARWQQIAYGHRPLVLEDVNQLAELYRRHFVQTVEP